MTHSQSPRQPGRASASVWTPVRTVTTALALLTLATAANAAELSVRVVDPQTNARIEGARLTAYRLKKNGTLRQVARAVTDESGETVFQLRRLSRDGRYVIHARWKNRRLRSPVLNRVASHQFSVSRDGRGMVDKKRPKVRIRKVDEAVIANSFVISGTATDDSAVTGVDVRVRDRVQGDTTVAADLDPDTGRWTATFSDDAVTANKRFRVVAIATDTRGRKGKHRIKRKLSGEEPTVPLEVIVTSPEDNATVSPDGFEVTGSVSDVTNLQSALLSISAADATVILENQPITPDANGGFTYEVPAELLAPAQSYTLKISVADLAGANSTTSVQIIAAEVVTTDNSVTIDSPADGGTIAASGFALSGLISSDANIAGATVSVKRNENVVVSATPITVGTDGSFNEQIETSALNAGDVVDVTVAANLEGGSEVSHTSRTRVPADLALNTTHLLSRTTFGATTDLVNQVNAEGAEAFLNEQLNPNGIDDSAFESFLGSFSPEEPDELAWYALVRMVSSKRQLQEVMTQFWDNHFNTFVYASSGDFGNETRFEFQENNAFRDNALGRFEDLLMISAKSPSMLIYLDNVVNRREDANENYARELIELHTLGVDNGYERADIEAAAEIFTGWHLAGDDFDFDAGEHNSDAQTFLGEAIAEGGVEQGETLLRILATHPGTAGFICGKLTQLLIADDAPQSAVDSCVQTFLSNVNADDQIAQVVRGLVLSDAFKAANRNKVKTPIEFLTSAIRGFGATGTGASLVWFANRLGMRPFTMPVPTGYSELAVDWMNTNQLVERIKWSHEFSNLNEGNENLGLDPLGWANDRNLQTTESIVEHLEQLLFGGELSAAGRTTLIETLNAGGTFDPAMPGAEEQLRRAIGIALSLPGFNYQ